jgi:hypothetical protein
MRFVKCEIREGAGRSGSVKASAMVRRNQDEAKRTDGHDRDNEPSRKWSTPDQHEKSLGS